MILWTLFATFFKIGLFSFGGGYAMLPLIEKQVIHIHQWITMSDFVDMLAVVEMTPGPVAINTATLVGYRVAGIPGGLLATLGVVLPSVIVIVLIAKFLTHFNDNKYVRWAFSGLRPVVLGLIGAAAVSVSQNAVKDIFGIAIVVVVFYTTAIKKVHPIVMLLLSGAAGLIYYGLL